MKKQSINYEATNLIYNKWFNKAIEYGYSYSEAVRYANDKVIEVIYN